MEENNELIELIDENGDAANFVHLMTLEHENEYFIALMTAESAEKDDDEDGEIIILKLEKDENDEDCYVSIDDENLAQTVFEKFLAILEEDDDEDAEFADTPDDEA